MSFPRRTRSPLIVVTLRSAVWLVGNLRPGPGHPWRKFTRM